MLSDVLLLNCKSTQPSHPFSQLTDTLTFRVLRTWVDFEYSKIKFCPNPQKIAFMTGSKVAIFDITTLQERG